MDTDARRRAKIAYLEAAAGSSRSRDELARSANGAHARVQAAVSAALGDARLAGVGLLAAKAQLPHSAWGAWLREDFYGSTRTARLYI